MNNSNGLSTVSQSLTSSEQADYKRCKYNIQSGLEGVARALEIVRDGKLWRDEYSSFADFCKGEFGKSQRRVNQIIAALHVDDNLKQLDNTREQLFPEPDEKWLIPESVAREIASEPPQIQRDIIEQASASGRPTAKTVRALVRPTKPKRDIIEATVTVERAPIVTGVLSWATLTAFFPDADLDPSVSAYRVEVYPVEQ